MTCATVMDHEWGAERIVGTMRHPVTGAIAKMERQCQRCGRVQRWTQRAERPAYEASHEHVAVFASE